MKHSKHFEFSFLPPVFVCIYICVRVRLCVLVWKVIQKLSTCRRVTCVSMSKDRSKDRLMTRNPYNSISHFLSIFRFELKMYDNKNILLRIKIASAN